jgi:hypothetical protein
VRKIKHFLQNNKKLIKKNNEKEYFPHQNAIKMGRKVTVFWGGEIGRLGD